MTLHVCTYYLRHSRLLAENLFYLISGYKKDCFFTFQLFRVDKRASSLAPWRTYDECRESARHRGRNEANKLSADYLPWAAVLNYHNALSLSLSLLLSLFLCLSIFFIFIGMIEVSSTHAKNSDFEKRIF